MLRHDRSVNGRWTDPSSLTISQQSFRRTSATSKLIRKWIPSFIAWKFVFCHAVFSESRTYWLICSVLVVTLALICHSLVSIVKALSIQLSARWARKSFPFFNWPPIIHHAIKHSTVSLTCWHFVSKWTWPHWLNLLIGSSVHKISFFSVGLVPSRALICTHFLSAYNYACDTSSLLENYPSMNEALMQGTAIIDLFRVQQHVRDRLPFAHMPRISVALDRFLNIVQKYFLTTVKRLIVKLVVSVNWFVYVSVKHLINLCKLAIGAEDHWNKPNWITVVSTISISLLKVMSISVSFSSLGCASASRYCFTDWSTHPYVEYSLVMGWSKGVHVDQSRVQKENEPAVTILDNHLWRREIWLFCFRLAQWSPWRFVFQISSSTMFSAPVTAIKVLSNHRISFAGRKRRVASIRHSKTAVLHSFDQELDRTFSGSIWRRINNCSRRRS